MTTKLKTLLLVILMKLPIVLSDSYLTIPTQATLAIHHTAQATTHTTLDINPMDIHLILLTAQVTIHTILLTAQVTIHTILHTAQATTTQDIHLTTIAHLTIVTTVAMVAMEAMMVTITTAITMVATLAMELMTTTMESNGMRATTKTMMSTTGP